MIKIIVRNGKRNKMKVLIINGSPRPQGNTKVALDEMVKILK